MDDYSSIGTDYASLSERRLRYNTAIDNQFVQVVQSAGKRWLDVGTGDGERALKLNRLLAKDLTVVEPSSLLADSFELEHTKVQVIRAPFGEFDASQKFDVISALWNVVGHVDSLEMFIARAWDLLDDNGILFFDVNSPFNLRRFGVKAVMRNWSSRKNSYSFAWHSAVPSTVNFYRISFIVAQLESAGFSPSISCFDYESGRQVSSSFLGSVALTARKPLRGARPDGAD